MPFLTLSLRPYGPVQHQPQPAPGFLTAKVLSHLSTEDQRVLQCLQPHSCCTCQTSISAPLPLHSAHVFPRLTTNPAFMCIIGSLGLSGVTVLETLIHVAVTLAMLSLLVCSAFCLFVCLFVSLFPLNCGEPHCESGSTRAGFGSRTRPIRITSKA